MNHLKEDETYDALIIRVSAAPGLITTAKILQRIEKIL